MSERKVARVSTDVPVRVAERLRRRARSQQRSVAAEVRRIILRALDEEEAESA